MLFIRLGAIGDVIQCAVALAIYKKKFPGVRVCWAVNQTLASFVESLEVADKVIQIDYEGLVKGSFLSRLCALVRESRKLIRYGPFAKIFNAHGDPRYKLLTLAMGVGRNVKLGRKFPIFHRYRVFEYSRLLGSADSQHIDFKLGFQSIRESLLFCSNSRGKVIQSSRYVVLSPGGAKNLIGEALLRRWPIGHYVELAKKIINIGYNVVLVGGEADSELGDAFAGIKLENMIGKTDLIQLFSLMEQATAIVTHDSGPLHIAVLTSAPLVATFGPTPANAFIPFDRYRTYIIHQQNKISCSPCYDGKSYADCSDNRCMKRIGVEDVFSTLISAIDTERVVARSED